MKKIDILNSALAESGLTAEAVIKSWYEEIKSAQSFCNNCVLLVKKQLFRI